MEWIQAAESAIFNKWIETNSGPNICYATSNNNVQSEIQSTPTDSQPAL